jgi:hypothetical protein
MLQIDQTSVIIDGHGRPNAPTRPSVGPARVGPKCDERHVTDGD